ncbi:hypothetical protein L7F22_022898 [Adiantum nelumboides]|nr:hypothetical protein [Adiantum nelumboides]
MKPLSRTSSACFTCSSPSSYPAQLRSSICCRDTTSPHDSLVSGRWVKLICGASFEDVADVRNLSLVYTLAGGMIRYALKVFCVTNGACIIWDKSSGILAKSDDISTWVPRKYTWLGRVRHVFGVSVDCIDCAADLSVVRAVREGVDAAAEIALTLLPSEFSTMYKPWIMVSINDEEDVHFRKAVFDSSTCPATCPRPCEQICPASAIVLSASLGPYLTGGVLNDRCYGCGRCISVCPLGIIGANSYTRNYKDVSNLLDSRTIDAVEIHTSARCQVLFKSVNIPLLFNIQALTQSFVSSRLNVCNWHLVSH